MKARLLGLLLCLLGLGCRAPYALIRVESLPSGADIYLDSLATGLQTPAELQLDLEQPGFLIECRKPGFAAIRQEVRRVYEVYTPTDLELLTVALYSPCCLGLPLLSFLVQQQNPLGYYNPMLLQLNLPMEGQGAVLRGSPRLARLELDGADAGVWRDDGQRLTLPPGPHQLRVLAEGYEALTFALQVEAGVYQSLAVQPQAAGQALLLSGSPGCRVRIDGGPWQALSAEPRRFELEVGAHELELQRSSGEETRQYALEPGQELNVHFR